MAGMDRPVLHTSKIVVCLFHKNGDDCDLNNYRQQSIRTVDYKILAKIIMNGVNDVCIIIDKK